MQSRWLGVSSFAAVVALALTACGGSGGGGNGGGTANTGSPPPPATGGGSEPVYGIPSSVAETAARSLPMLGSVTQSSNAAAGVTRDRARLDHAGDGSLGLSVSREDGAGWTVSTAGETELEEFGVGDVSPLVPGGRSVDVGVRDGTTLVYMATTKRGNLGPAPGAERFGEGDTIDVTRYPSEVGWVDAGAYYDKVDGQGYYCVSETGSCVVSDDDRVVEGTLYLKRGGPAAVVRSWDPADDGYLTLGWWLRTASASAQPEVGVFVDGGRPFAGSELTGLTGTGSYGGIAFAHALGDSRAADAAPFLVPSSEGEGLPQLSGPVELTADFDTGTVGGTVRLSGDPDNYDSEGEPAEPSPIVLTLASAPIDAAARGGFFTGDTGSDGTSSVSGLSGKWGGQFFGAPGVGGLPPHAAGTFGAQRPGFAVLGGYLAREGLDVDDFFGDSDDMSGPPTVPPVIAPAEHPVERIGETADSLLVSDLIVSADILDTDLRIQTSCSGTACTLNILGEQETVSLSDFAGDTDGEWPEATETRRGVSLVSETVIDGVGDSLGELTGYGGWLDHNFFIVAHATISDEEIGDVSIPLAMSIGDATGTNPTSATGSATWSGVMVGTDASATASRSHRIRGDADITIAEFADPRIGVAFTNIRDLDSGGARSDMTWSGIPMVDGGFATGSDGNSIEGRFYGPNHEEVGGIFERDRVVGAFGAQRR